MKLKRLFLLSGVAGSGKSTYAKTKVETEGGVWISRDAIRFSIVQEGEEYFSREDEVFSAFISQIQEQINNPLATNIYVDATHLTRKARQAVLGRLNLDTLDEINCIYFDIPCEVAIERNEPRIGQAHVPRSVIRKMWFSHTPPESNEKFDHIIFIDEYGVEREVVN